jgi:hypothetical protein
MAMLLCATHHAVLVISTDLLRVRIFNTNSLLGGNNNGRYPIVVATDILLACLSIFEVMHHLPAVVKS